jgi:hypothetical protein
VDAAPPPTMARAGGAHSSAAAAIGNADTGIMSFANFILQK